MSLGVLDLGIQAGQRLKREYSKSGCRECKRRKIKCDEDKPCCWQCLRLKKECTYPAAGEKVARVSKKKWRQIKSRDQEMKETVNKENQHDPQHQQHIQQTQSLQYQQPVQSTRPLKQTQHIQHTQKPVQRLSEVQDEQLVEEPVQQPAQQPLQSFQQNRQIPPIQQRHQQIHPLQQLQHHKHTLQPIPPQHQPQTNHPHPHTNHPNQQYLQRNQYDQYYRNPYASYQIPIGQYNTRLQEQGGNGVETPRGAHVQSDVTKGSHISPAQHPPPFPHQYAPQPSPPNSQTNQEAPQLYQFQNSPKYTTSSIVNLLNDVPKDGHPSPTISTFSSPNVHQNQKQEKLPENDMLLYFDQEDLDLFATDLNNFVHSIVIDSNFQTKVDLDHESVDSNGFSLRSSTTTSTPMVSNDLRSPMVLNALKPTIAHNLTSRNIPLDYIKVKKPREKLYLEEFFNNFASMILPFCAYDKATEKYFNPARDIILKAASNEPFLLAAVLAHGAKLSHQKHNLAEEEEAYCTYLSKCLKLLGPALNSSGNKDLSSNIETVLLTVLLLTSANAANTKQDWRPHLRGAKDLLLKNALKKVQNSHILIFCKCWFITLEILAGISSKLGGTLKTDQEIDLLIKMDDEYEIAVLKQLGCVLDNGFNLFVGYHIDCIGYLRDLIKMLSKQRRLREANQEKAEKSDKNSHEKGIKNEEKFTTIVEPIPYGNWNGSPEDQSDNLFQSLELISNFYIQSQREFVNRRCVLRPYDFPNNIPQGLLLDVLKINEKSVVVSWMDLSHQAYVMAAMITLLTKCFKELHDSPQVQMLTNRLVSLVEFTKDTNVPPQQEFQCSMMMLQWPMLVAGMNCIDEDSRLILTSFFGISAQIGSASASFALKRVSKVWRLMDRSEVYSSEHEDEDEDVLSY